MPPTQAVSSWKNLEEHQKKLQGVHMRDLFAADKSRFEKFHVKFEDILLDFSKNIITDETIPILMQLANESNLKMWIEKMFSGEKINNTEDRAVLHVALRNRSNSPIFVDGNDVMPEINAVLSKMRKWTESIRNGEWRGYTGKKITDVVNIGYFSFPYDETNNLEYAIIYRQHL
jgi:glucose-6-phosphate isomerase